MYILIAAAIFLMAKIHGTSLKIYIYDLPQWKNVSNFGKSSKGPDISSSDYGLDQLFPEILKASAYVTDKPEEADYFFVDAWIFWPQAMNHMDDIVAAIRAMGTWFDRKNASDHIFVITADQGRCEYEERENRNPHHAVRNAIFLQHYGGSLHSSDFFNSDLTERWGGELDRLMVMTEAMISQDRCSVPNVRCTEDAYGRKTPFLCHVPYQDIVIPPAVFERRSPHDCHHCHLGVDSDLAYKIPYAHPDAAALSANRTTMLLHAGDTHFHDRAYYSLGARQTMIQMFGNRKDFLLHEGAMGQDYWQNLLTTVFCLATTGTGWGSRLKVALVKGCIPVIMMDGVKAEFEDELPLFEYAIRIPGFMAFRTPAILQQFIDKGRVKQMQENLKCAWRLHWWRKPHGKAFEVVMCELKRRKMNMSGIGKPRIMLDFKACTMTCIDEVIQLSKNS